MEAEARYTIVGAVVLLMVCAIIGIVLWLQNYNQEDEFTRYQIHFENQRVDGLQVDGTVDLRGVRIGRVESYELADYVESGAVINRVTVIISIDRNVQLFTNTVAIITRNLITGIAQISLVNQPSADALPLSVSAPGFSSGLPVIAEGRSDLDEIAGKVEYLGDMAAEIMVSLNRLLSIENTNSFISMIGNANQLLDNLNQRMDELDEVLTGLNEATASIDAAGGNVSILAENADGHIAQLTRDTRATIQQAELAMQNIAQAVAALEQQGDRLTGQMDRTGAVVSDQVAAAVAELRIMLDSAATTIEQLQDPRSAVLGVNPARLGPGEQP